MVAQMSAGQEKNAEEKETVSHEKKVVKIPDIKNGGAGEKPYYSSKHQQSPEYSGSPAEIIDDFIHFHMITFW